MHTEGNEVHETTDEARAGSTPNVVRWVLAIGLVLVIVAFAIIVLSGMASTDEADRVANTTDRVENATEDSGDATDSIVSDQLAAEAPAATGAPSAAESPAATQPPAPSPTPQ